MPRITHLKALQALEATMRLGTLKKAADELGVTPAALGQRIRSLELYLDLQLLERSPRGTLPTEAALEAAEDLGAAFKILDSVAKKLQFQRLSEVYIRADADWAQLWLEPKLKTFHEQNPPIQVIVETDAEPAVGHRADFEVSFSNVGGGDDTTLLFTEYMVPVSSPQTFRRLNKIPEDVRLEGYPLLHLMKQTNEPFLYGWPEWVDSFGHRGSVTGRGIQYARVSHGLRAVRSNAGPLICGLSLVLDEIENGTLILPFGAAKGAWSDYGFYLRSRKGADARPQTRKFLEWLLAEAAKTDARQKSLCPPLKS